MLDEQLPAKHLKPPLNAAGHTAEGVRDMGWSGLKNGELLNAYAAHGFEALLTADRNMAYQQHAAKLPLPVVVLQVTSTHKDHLLRVLPLVHLLLEDEDELQPNFYFVGPVAS